MMFLEPMVTVAIGHLRCVLSNPEENVFLTFDLTGSFDRQGRIISQRCGYKSLGFEVLIWESCTALTSPVCCVYSPLSKARERRPKRIRVRLPDVGLG